MRLNRFIQFSVIIFLAFSTIYSVAEEASYEEQISYVGSGWSVTYRVFKDPFRIVPLAINGKPLDEAEKKEALIEVNKLHKLLSRRPSHLKKKIVSSETLDLKFDGILVFGGENDWLYLFPKNESNRKLLREYTGFLRDFRKTRNK